MYAGENEVQSQMNNCNKKSTGAHVYYMYVTCGNSCHVTGFRMTLPADLPLHNCHISHYNL